MNALREIGPSCPDCGAHAAALHTMSCPRYGEVVLYSHTREGALPSSPPRPAPAQRTSRQVAAAIRSAVAGLNTELRHAHDEGFRLVGDTCGRIEPTAEGIFRLRFEPHVTGPQTLAGG